jgi:hypothetical protein
METRKQERKVKRTFGKVLLSAMIVTALFAVQNANGQQRTKIAEGLTLIRNGNEFGIEDDINQKTWWITISRQKQEIESSTQNSSSTAGEWVYYVACGNKYSKNVLKYGLSATIGGAVASTGVSAFFSGAAGVLTSTIYDDVCKYFGEKK